MLDDIRRALRMDSPAPRLNDSHSNIRKLSRGLRSSKKSRLSVHSALETNSVQDGVLGGRSVSLSTLLPASVPPGSVPRVDKLQTLEAKMADIEVSLGWRRRREALLETLPRAARDLVRELDSLHQSVKDKDTTIQSLRNQITNLGGTVTGNDGMNGGVLCETERRTIQERLEKVQTEMEAKKVAIKNLKLTLEKIDLTDNIDVRIRAAELEYELEREELNVLNLKEEASILANRLQDSNVGQSSSTNSSNSPKTKITFYELLQMTSVIQGTTLVAANVSHTPGNPPFHVTSRPPFGCVIDWATDDTRLKKGDRLVEMNGILVVGGDIEEVTKLMSASSVLSLIVARPTAATESTLKKLEKQLEDKQKENKDLVARLDKALRERDNYKNDSTRLNHRICYLEDQVGELENMINKPSNLNESTSPNSKNCDAPAPSQPGATIIQVFQKGNSTMGLQNDQSKQPQETLSSISSSDSDISLRSSNDRKDSKEIDGLDSSPSASPPTSISSNEKAEGSDEQREVDSGADCSTYSSTETQPRKRISKDNYVLYNGDKDKSEKKRGAHFSSHHDYELQTNKMSLSPNDSYEKREYSAYETNYKLSLSEERTSWSQTSNSYSDYSSIKPKYGEDIYRIQNRRISYSKSPNRDSSSDISPQKGESTKSHKIYTVDRPRRFLSPSHELRKGEELKLPRPRPVPPKKPERLSLQRTTSLQSVEDNRPNSRASSVASSVRQYTNGGHSWHSYDNDLHTDGEATDWEERSSHRIENYHRSGFSYGVTTIPEERPSPTPRNSVQQKKLSSNYEHHCMISGKSESPLVPANRDSSPSPIYGRTRQSKSRPKSPDASFHLDSSLGLEPHQNARPQPMYEYLRRAPSREMNGHHHYNHSSSPPVPKPRERDMFHAPPTPSTPARGLDLQVVSPHRTNEEWC